MTPYLSDPLPTSASRAARLRGGARTRLAFGLSWRTFAVSEAKAERLRHARSRGATHMSERRIGAQQKEIQSGVGTFSRKAIRGARLYAGAAWLAALPDIAAHPAALVLIEAESQVLVVLIVRDVIRVDETVSFDALDARRLELETMAAQAGAEPVVFVHGDYLVERARVDERLLDMDGLLARAATRAPVGRLAPLPWQMPPALKGLVVLGGVGLGVYHGMQWLNPPPPPPEPLPTPEQLYRQTEAALFAQVLPQAAIQIPAMLRVFERVEVVRAGWRFQHAECTFGPAAATVGHCSITWRRTGGTFAEFDHVASTVDRPLTFAVNGETLSSAAPAVPILPGVGQSDRARWPNWLQLVARLQTPAQALSMRLDALESHGYSVALGEPQRLIPQPVSLGRQVMKGNWEIAGQSWQMPLIEALPPNLAVERVELDLKPEGLMFKAKGTYYVLS